MASSRDTVDFSRKPCIMFTKFCAIAKVLNFAHGCTSTSIESNRSEEEGLNVDKTSPKARCRSVFRPSAGAEGIGSHPQPANFDNFEGDKIILHSTKH